MRYMIYTFPSMTYVMKARTVLSGRGIRSEAVHISKANDKGCKYGLRVKASDCKYCADIFALNGILYLDVL